MTSSDSSTPHSASEDRPPFRDPGLPLDRRVEDLLGRLTLDERTAMLHQFAPAVERLGVAAFRTGQEALHGVAWMGGATVFPQAVGLGATWNSDLVRRVGEAVGTEARAMRAKDERVGLNIWAPTVNLLRHPLWGRNEEGYAEDARLTSSIAVAYTRGLRGDHPRYWRTAPVLKHWLAHNNETSRDTSSSSVRPRVLHEYDLRAFRAAVEAGAVAGVMPAYNLVNGRPNHVSPYLREHLRTWTEDELLVCSDAGAPSNLVDSEKYFAGHEEATAAALIAGIDSFTDHGTDSSVTVGRIRRAYERGLITEADIDTAVRRQLSVRFRLGEFEPHLDPYARLTDFDTPEHRALALEAAEQAVVLLRNDGLLPLDPAAGQRIAVVGLLADECRTDWYSGTLLHRSTPLDGLIERFGADRVTFAEGADRVRLRCAAGWVNVPAAEATGTGTVRGAAGALDPALLTGRTDLPPLAIGDEPTELALADWGDGALTLRAPDGHYLSVADDGHVRASADRPGGWVVQETFTLVPGGDGEGGHLLRHTGTGGYVSVTAGGLRIAEGREQGETFFLDVAERGEDAVTRAATAADVVIVVAGNDPHINGRETQDRTTLALPPQQDRLWRAAAAAGARTVLVLTSSYPYAVTEADAALPAVLWTAHGGQSAGTALARVLAGDVSPAGRLPQTWYAADDDLPAGLLDYDVIGSGQTYLYHGGTPLYGFGHGLTYTSFVYERLTAVRKGGSIHLSLTVTNTGPAASDEVVQLYFRPTAPSVHRPLRQLAAHRRIHLVPGASRALEFEVPLDELGFWDVAHSAWTVEPGHYEFVAGPSSTDPRVSAGIDLDGPPLAPRAVLAEGVEAAAYDDGVRVALVDRTKWAGDAVTPDGAKPCELRYVGCDFGSGTTGVSLTVSGHGTVAVAGVTTGVEVDVPDTGAGRYDYTEVRAAIGLSGVQDLTLTLNGPLRLARIAFDG